MLYDTDSSKIKDKNKLGITAMKNYFVPSKRELNWVFVCSDMPQLYDLYVLCVTS